METASQNESIDASAAGGQRGSIVIRNYAYRCEPASLQDWDVLEKQLRLGLWYRKELARIENRARALWRARRASLGDCAPVLARALRGLYQDESVKERFGQVLDQGAESGATFGDRLAELVRAGLSPDLAWYALTAHVVSDGQRRACLDVRRRYVERGLEWGTYQAQDEGHAASCRTTSGLSDVDVPFVDEQRLEGPVAVHLQPARALRAEGDRWVQFGRDRVHHSSQWFRHLWLRRDLGPAFRESDLVVRPADQTAAGRLRVTPRHTEVRLRVGSVPGTRDPVWLTLHARVERPVPAGARVSWAKVLTHWVGPRLRFRLVVTFSCDAALVRRGATLGGSATGEARDLSIEPHRPPAALPVGVARPSIEPHRPPVVPPAGSPRLSIDYASLPPAFQGPPPSPVRADAVGVDLGWRQFPDGSVRIAYWVGSDGQRGELRISARVLGAGPKSDSLRAIRDREFHAARNRVAAWAKSFPDRDAWVVRQAEHLAQWTNHARFLRFLERWRSQRVVGDEGIWQGVVLPWLKSDRHLWSWEASGRAKMARRVAGETRKFVVRVASQYHTVGIEAPIVADLVQDRGRCDACADQARRCDACFERERLRRLAAKRVARAAPAGVRQDFLSLCASHGATLREVDPAYTTIDCDACGFRRSDVTDWSSLVVRCSACGRASDQDATAAKNLMARARDWVPPPEKAKKKLPPRRNRRGGSADGSTLPPGRDA